MLRKGFLIPHRKYCEKYGFYHFMTSSLNAEKTLHGNENMHMHLQKKYMHSDAMKSRMKKRRIKSKARQICNSEWRLLNNFYLQYNRDFFVVQMCSMNIKLFINFAKHIVIKSCPK